jgi:hypothetical protein
MNIQKMPFQLSALGLSASIVTASGLGLFTNTSIVQAQKTVTRPSIARVTRIDNGDNACYVSLVNQKGQKFESLPADFDICAKSQTFLNKRVRLTYAKGKINDCQSAEPCGKTKTVMLIRKMQVVK